MMSYSILIFQSPISSMIGGNLRFKILDGSRHPTRTWTSSTQILLLTEFGNVGFELGPVHVPPSAGIPQVKSKPHKQKLQWTIWNAMHRLMSLKYLQSHVTLPSSWVKESTQDIHDSYLLQEWCRRDLWSSLVRLQWQKACRRRPHPGLSTPEGSWPHTRSCSAPPSTPLG